MNSVYYILLVISAAISAFSQVLLKKSANKKYKGILFEYLNPLVIIAYFFFFGVLFLNIYIFTLVEYKYGIIINSISTVLVLFLSNLILKERVTIRKVIGNILIFFGIVIFCLIQ